MRGLQSYNLCIINNWMCLDWLTDQRTPKTTVTISLIICREYTKIYYWYIMYRERIFQNSHFRGSKHHTSLIVFKFDRSPNREPDHYVFNIYMNMGYILESRVPWQILLYRYHHTSFYSMTNNEWKLLRTSLYTIYRYTIIRYNTLCAYN